MNDNIVTAAIAYLAADDAAPQIRVFPPVSGKPVATPRNVYVDMAIEDARNWRSQPTLDGAGFEYHRHLSSCTDFYDDAQVSTIYYPVETRILHYGEDEEDTPRHTGHIYSLQYGAQHRWAYVSAMQPDEMLLLKCYDSSAAGRARFTPHTGFHNPACPPEFTARESIEARTLVIFHDNQE